MIDKNPGETIYDVPSIDTVVLSVAARLQTTPAVSRQFKVLMSSCVSYV
jgi:hypothetical protein